MWCVVFPFLFYFFLLGGVATFKLFYFILFYLLAFKEKIIETSRTTDDKMNILCKNNLEKSLNNRLFKVLNRKKLKIKPANPKEEGESDFQSYHAILFKCPVVNKHHKAYKKNPGKYDQYNGTK